MWVYLYVHAHVQGYSWDIVGCFINFGSKSLIVLLTELVRDMEETYASFWKHPSVCLFSLPRPTVFPDNPASVCLLIRMPQSISSRLRNQKLREGNSSFQHSCSASASCLWERIKDSVMWSGSGSKLNPNCSLAQCHSAGGQKSFCRARSWSKMIFWGRPLPLWCILALCFLLSKSLELTDVVFSELLINLFAVFLLFQVVCLQTASSPQWGQMWLWTATMTSSTTESFLPAGAGGPSPAEAALMRWSSQTGHPSPAGSQSGICCRGLLRRATCPWPSGGWRRQTLGCTDAVWKFQAGSMTTNTRLLWLWLQVRNPFSACLSFFCCLFKKKQQKKSCLTGNLWSCWRTEVLLSKEGFSDDELNQFTLIEGLIGLHIDPRCSPFRAAQPPDSGNKRGEGEKPDGSVDSCVWWRQTTYKLQGWSQKQTGYEHKRDAGTVQGLGVNGVLRDSASWDTAVITQVLNPELTQLTLVDLRPAKTYNLRMFATNSLGTSHTSNVLTITTKEAGRAEAHRTLFCIKDIFMDSLFCWILCVLSTRGSSSGHAAGEPHCSQHQSHVEGQLHTHNSVCCVFCQIPPSSS